MSPKEQMRLDFADSSRHFLLMVRREGKAQGSGLLNGAAVTEFGYHDILPGADGKPKLLDNGFWEVVGATGKLKGLKGAGTLHIKAVSPSDREFELTGELVTAS